MTWEEKLAIYDEIVSLTKTIKRLGKTMPYTAENTYMFSMLNKAGQLGIRLSKEDRSLFYQKYTDEPFISYGATIKDYVLIPEEVFLHRKEEVAECLLKGFAYVKSLKPQPRKKK